MGNGKALNLPVFIALMGTSALALTTKMIFDSPITDAFSYLLEISVMVIFIVHFLRFITHLIERGDFLDNLKNPQKSNLYSAIPIASALISIMLVRIGLPFIGQHDTILSSAFWFVSLLFSLLFIVVVPINLKFRSAPEHVMGTWFLPPVGLFVLVSAGSTLGMAWPQLSGTISLINLMMLGPAFILYILTLNLLYLRSKFYDFGEAKAIPTFNIVLAPVGVSILAMLTTSSLLLENNLLGLGALFSGISKIYSLIMFGYGLWVLLGLSFLYYRLRKEKGGIPLSELWWAFIFPIGAFVLSCVSLYSLTGILFIRIVYLALYFVLLALWAYVLLRQHLIKPRRAKHAGG